MRRGDVLSAWCGIRPLVSDPNKPDTQSLARNHIVHVSPKGLVTIAGGKWTTYRSMAVDAMDSAIEGNKNSDTRVEYPPFCSTCTVYYLILQYTCSLWPKGNEPESDRRLTPGRCSRLVPNTFHPPRPRCRPRVGSCETFGLYLWRSGLLCRQTRLTYGEKMARGWDKDSLRVPLYRCRGRLQS